MTDNNPKPARKESGSPAKSSRVVNKEPRPGLLLYWNLAGQFLQEVKTELRKVVWPPRRQAMTSTGVVLVLVTIASIFLGLVDFGLARVVGLIIGRS